ncbi:MAG: serine/threonine protein kinase [Proteobacteria bacterium]|nr:serine/threonine protein kinase [Pseudomonadota bacterium]
MADRTRLKDLFDQAIEVAPHERAAWIAQVCGDDAELRAALERWLRADGAFEDFLQAPPAALTQIVAAALADGAPQRFGAWRVLRSLGAGGMGKVWQAERDDGEFEQRVAIKQVAYPTQALMQRFRQERRILARLDHPNIARLIDGAVDVLGVPYLVMEFVDGQAITAYANERGLDPHTRAKLFLPVLDAVQSAHSQLIVHRDIKPGNVLVDTHGTPKLLDFGIAKLLEDDGGAARTRTALRALTPDYASPEQIRGDAIGTPSDIYSLGVLLYELLVGARPYEIAGTSPAAIERAVCDTEPARPSLRMQALGGSSAAGARDLDAILLKALAKDPGHRYASCAEFSADLRRWLAGESVLARVPTTRERVQRYVARHKLGVALAASAVLALLVGLATIAALYRQSLAAQAEAIRQKNTAEREAAAAKAVRDFLDEDIIRAASPYLKTSAQDITVREAIDRGTAKIGVRFKDQPAIEGEIRAALGGVYMQLNQYAKAADQYAASGKLLEATLGEASAKTRYVRYASAVLLSQQYQAEKAHTLLQQLDALAQPGDENDAALATMRDDAWDMYWYRQHDWNKEEPFALRTIADFQRWQPDNLPGLAVHKANLVILYTSSGRLADGERVARGIVDELHAHGDDATVGYGLALSMLGRIEYFRRDYAAAEKTSLAAVALLSKIQGARSPHALNALYIVVRVRMDSGRYAETLDAAREIHASFAAAFGEHSVEASQNLVLLGACEYLAGQRDQGIRDMQAGLAGTVAMNPSATDPLEKFFVAGNYIDYGAGKLEAAKALVAQLDMDSLRGAQPDNDWPARLDALRGQIAYLDGDRAKARTLLQPALDKMVAAHSPVFEIDRTRRTLEQASAAK